FWLHTMFISSSYAGQEQLWELWANWGWGDSTDKYDWENGKVRIKKEARKSPELKELRDIIIFVEGELRRRVEAEVNAMLPSIKEALDRLDKSIALDKFTEPSLLVAKSKGFCVDCLNLIIGNDTLLEKALNGGFNVKTDIKPARLKLINPDQPFLDTTICDREIRSLIDLGIFIRLSDGRIKFSDIMMKPGNKGPPDKEYTRSLIRQMIEIEYPIGKKGEIPTEIRPVIKKTVIAIAQPSANDAAAQDITAKSFEIANKIHTENLKHQSAIPEKTILCHVV
ncbi:unnamed protein product, partial [marine sediment metagenome]